MLYLSINGSSGHGEGGEALASLLLWVYSLSRHEELSFCFSRHGFSGSEAV